MHAPHLLWFRVMLRKSLARFHSFHGASGIFWDPLSDAPVPGNVPSEDQALETNAAHQFFKCIYQYAAHNIKPRRVDNAKPRKQPTYSTYHRSNMLKLHLPIIALSLSGVLAVAEASSEKTAAYMKDRLMLTTREASSHNIRGTTDSRRLQDEICLPEYTYTTEEGCTNSGLADTFENLEEALSDVGCDHDAMRELELVLDVEGEEAVFDFFWNKCSEFWSLQEGRNFAEIGDGTDLFIKEFFDGTFLQTVILLQLHIDGSLDSL